MSKFCGKCGSKLNENGFCIKCDRTPKMKSVIKGIIIALILTVFILSSLILLTYFSIIDIPFVSSILSSMGINNSNNESDITFQNFDEEDIVFDNGELYVKSQLLITADDSFTYEDVKKAVMKYGGDIVGAINITNDYQIELDNKNFDELNNIAENLKKDLSGSDIGLHKVFYTEEYTSSNNNKDEKDGDWWRDAISLNALEQREVSYSNINVGIFDTVFDTSNKDLSGVFKSEWQNYGVVKTTTHGTSVAGFISAKKNNDYGIDGVSDNCSIYGFSYDGNQLHKYPTSIMKYKYAIALMLNSDVKIINFSNGYDEMCVGAQHEIKEACIALEKFSESLSTFLEKYLNYGYDFLITKAAGNQNNQTWIECDISEKHPYGVKSYDKNEDGDLNSCKKLPDTVYTPKYDIFGAITNVEVKNHIIIVGAAESHGYKLTYYPAAYSARGERVDIYAPGENLKCLIPENDDGDSTEIAGGTSFSAPIVAGVASLVWGANPDISAIDVRNAILNTASLDISGENKKMIDAFFAVNYALQLKKVKEDSDNSVGVVMGAVKINSEELDIYAPFANISFKNKETSTDTKIQTDSNGLFDVMLDSGDYVISVSLDGYNTYTREISVKNDDVVYIDDILLSKNIDVEKNDSDNSNSKEDTSSVDSSSGSNRVSFGEYSLLVPSNWIYEQDDDYVYFYEESIYDASIHLGYTVPTGIIVCIDKYYSETDVVNIPIRHQLLGDKDGVYYVAIYPSDVEVPTELMQSDIELFNSLNEKLSEERENSKNVFATFEWTNESEDKNTLATIQDSEDELKGKLKNGTNKSILHFYYDDFDSNGEYEAFAVVGEAEEDNWYYNADVWFVSCDTVLAVKSGIYGYANGILEGEKYTFVSLEQSAHGSGSTSFVFGVKDGVPQEMNISRNYGTFRVGANGIFIGYRSDFSSGYHKYIYVEFSFDEKVFEFVPTGNEYENNPYSN